MSLASCSYQCGWLADDTMFTVSLLSVEGDIVQRYSGTAQNPNLIQPNYAGTTAGNGQVLRVILSESDPTVTQATLAKAVVDDETFYFIDGNKLTFGSNGISNAASTDPTYPYNGCFRKLKANSTGADIPVPTMQKAPYGGIEILDNLVKASGGRTINVSVSLGLSSGNKAFRKSGSTRIRIVPITGATDMAQIYCTGDSFVLDEDNPDVECKVRLYQGETEKTSGFYCKWYILEGGAWVQKTTPGKTFVSTDTLTYTVHKDDVATFADVKVECYSDSACTKRIASDVQTLHDASDAYIINPCPSPADGTFSQNGTQDVTFSPTLTDKDGNAASEAHQFNYTVMDSTGNILLSGSVNQGGSFTVQASVANGIGEGPIVNIEAVSI